MSEYTIEFAVNSDVLQARNDLVPATYPLTLVAVENLPTWTGSPNTSPSFNVVVLCNKPTTAVVPSD